MNPNEAHAKALAQFQRPSKEFLRLNPRVSAEQIKTAAVIKPVAKRSMETPALVFRINGIIRGGKNNMIVCRNGAHIPKPSWRKWRDDAVNQILDQIPLGFRHIFEPCNVRLDYIAGDQRRRDMPAIIDALFHVLEKAQVVTDDTLIWITESSRSYDKANPGVTITFL